MKIPGTNKLITAAAKTTADPKKRMLLILLSAAVVIAIVFLLLFLFGAFSPDGGSGNSVAYAVEYVPGNYPEGESFADVSTENLLSSDELYEAYNDDNDPAHPVLDVKTSLEISCLGSRPGEARPQDLDEEYPDKNSVQEASGDTEPGETSETQDTSANTNIDLPDFKPDIDLPNITLPELLIIGSDIEGPCFTGDEYTLEWSYTGSLDAVFDVSISADGGATFDYFDKNLSDSSYKLTFPNNPSDNCVLRVEAVFKGRLYKTAVTSKFILLKTPEPAPQPVVDYVDPQVQYTNLPDIHISSDISEKVWFNAGNSAQEASELIWQLSKSPYWGTSESFGTDTGIVAEGKLDSAGGEFSVDLRSLCEDLTEGGKTENEPFLISQEQYNFYMRIVALDKNGECIGDPGRGLSFIYGKADIAADLNSVSFAENSKIEIMVEMPYYSKWKWTRISPDVLDRDINSPSDDLLFTGMDDTGEGSGVIKNAVQVELQVSTSPFKNLSALGFTDPEGLVCSYLDTAPDIGESADGYNYMTPYFHGLEYDQFALSKEELDSMGGIYYYVRALFYVPDSENPSILHPMPSETMTIAYRVTSAKQNTVEQAAVESHMPFVQFLWYQPVDWQDPGCEEYFEVTRHIEASEMNFYIKNSDTGDFLLPFALHCKKYGWTTEQYQTKLDEMLPIGASIHYIKSEPGFWEEFFSLLSEIYTSVQKAYSDAKEAAVSLVDYIPFIGDDAKGFLKQAVRYTIDYGLVSIGIPPSLPNLDKLADEGFDYCLKIATDEALKQAGVPADSEAAKEITEKVREEVSKELGSELSEAIISMQQNPFRASFLRLDTNRLYEPAFVDVLIANYSDSASIPGTLGLGFGEHTEIYHSTVLPIPSLSPGESIVVRVYLDHVRNKYDGYNKYFDKIYNGISGQPFNLYLYTMYDLPDVDQAANAHVR